MKKLKLTGRIYLGYTGLVGRYRFEDGVSVEAIPQVERIRIAGNFSCVELEEDGSEGLNPSPAHNIVAGVSLRLLPDSLERQTEDEKLEENARLVLGSDERRLLLSEDGLEKVVQTGGIAGLREIADIWNVRSKSIPALIKLILEAQKNYTTERRAQLTARGIPVDEIDALLTPLNDVPKARAVSEPAVAMVTLDTEAPAVTEIPVEEIPVEEVLEAAASGDLAAALNVPDTSEA